MLPITFATLPSGNQPLSDFDTQFAAVAALGVVPCTASGTNVIALTPNANTPTINAYANYLRFSFVAAASSTGAVTINVNSLGALNAYKWGGLAVCGNGDIQNGGTYQAIFNQALNSGAGGFVVDTVGIGTQAPAGGPGVPGFVHNAAVEFVISGGGSAITTGVKGYLYIPWALNIVAWRMIADQSGSIAVDILRANLAVPSASIVGGGTKPNLTSQQIAASNPSGWTATTFAASDFIGFNVTSATTVTQVTAILECAKV